MKKVLYRFVVVLVLVGMLTTGVAAATAKSDIFVGSTELAKTLYENLNGTSSSFAIEGRYDSDTLADAMLEALAQNPYAAHASGWVSKTSTANSYTEVTPEYILKEDIRKSQKTELQKKVKSISKKIIKDGMTTEQKVDAIQRYIAANCEYDYDTLKLIVDGKNADKKAPDCFTAYGSLVNGKAVCQGYANAFKALADAAGIRNVIIFGKTNNGIPHSWNLVYDNKTWNTVDTSNLDLNMWQQAGAYVAPATAKARLTSNKQSIVDSQWKSIFSSDK